jgi:hypothetical protein
MKKYLLILILMLFSIIGVTQTKEQIKDLVKNNYIGMSADSLLKKFPEGFNSDTLNGIRYDIIKGRINKVLITCFLTPKEKTRQVTCFHYRLFIITSIIQTEDIVNILNMNFKESKNNWIQYSGNDTINWMFKYSRYTVILDAE